MKSSLSLHERLSRIQQELKVQKGRKNNFGKYQYRSAEDILEALKVFNDKYNVYFTISENLIQKTGFTPTLECTASIHDANPPKYYKDSYESMTVFADTSYNKGSDISSNAEVVKETTTTHEIRPVDIEPGNRWERFDNQTVTITAKAYAGVEKAGGMALPQAFGAASSYGKKYALGNLLLIDDSKDADETNNHGKVKKEPVDLNDLF